MKVEDEINRSQNEHGWSVASREHPWSLPDASASGFIDIVLKHREFSTFRMVIECKRIKAADARQLRWIFLLPNEGEVPTDLTSCFEVEGHRTNDLPSSGYGWDEVRVWDNVRVTPKSLQSEFCILQNDEQKRQSILEGLASEVLTSIEGIAQEEINIVRSYTPPLQLRLFIFPVIITNAEIVVCRFKSNHIKIFDGTLDAENVEISTVPFIRFRKSLATNLPQGKFRDLKAASQARERTVFIVNAASLPEFLKDWQLSPFDEFAMLRLMRTHMQ